MVIDVPNQELWLFSQSILYVLAGIRGKTKPSCDSRLVLAGVSSMVSFLYGKLLRVQQRALLCKCLILKKGDFLFFLKYGTI